MKPKEPPQEPDILYQRDIKKLTLENAKQILPPEHLKIFEKINLILHRKSENL